VPDDWYRDTPPNWSPGSGEAANAAGGSVLNSTLPVYLPEGVAMPTTSYAGIAGAVPDEVSHVAPRMRYVVKEGYYVAWDNASIPAVVQPTTRDVMYSNILTTELCTTAATSSFADGDICTVSKNGNTLVGVADTTRYIYSKVSDTTFKLLTEAGAIVDIGTTNVSPVFTLSLISTSQRPDNLPSGIAWYPMPCDIATADPRA
jgi:hypothetical protein